MRIFLLLLSVLIVASSRQAIAVDYVNDLVPILETYCISCHAADDAQGGLVMDSHAALMTGGESGLAVTSGVASSSRMFLMAAGKMEPVMPPDDMEGPTADELELLAEWINQGAKGPEGEMPLKRTLRTPMIATAEGVDVPITAMARSSDERLLAIARFGAIEVLTDKGTVITKLNKNLGKVNSLQFNQAGDRLLVGTGLTGAYGQAILFDVESGQVVGDFVGHQDVLYAARFSPDEKLVATAGYDRKILIWNVDTGDSVTEMIGHNGAIYDLDFSPDGKHLVSACADETAKIWEVSTGKRFDTLSQPEGEVSTVQFTPDGRFVIAGSADNRLRVWRFISKKRPRINPIVQTRFVDESPIVKMQTTQDGLGLVIVSEAGNIKLLRTSDWSVVTALSPVEDSVTDLSILKNTGMIEVSLMNGEIVQRPLPKITEDRQLTQFKKVEPVFLDLGPLKELDESKLNFASGVADVSRGVVINGKILKKGETDSYRFMAKLGEAWAMDADRVSGDLDPMIVIRDEDGVPVRRARLQAIRDTYFTFRGKNSEQTTDFRLFNWQEIGLDQYLYSNGEVTKTFMHPRGPDSGFNVYPNSGKRSTYFGTTHTTHALGEPAYVVRELEGDEPREPNGLPVFEIDYENDDDPSRRAGTSSRLLFTAPRDGSYLVTISDARGLAADDFDYNLRIRPAKPSFTAKLGVYKGEIRPGTGQEFPVVVDRLDGFDGSVEFSISGLSSDWQSTFPVIVEAGQREASGVIWVPEGTDESTSIPDIRVTARATINGIVVERDAGSLQRTEGRQASQGRSDDPAQRSRYCRQRELDIERRTRSDSVGASGSPTRRRFRW